MATDSVLDFSFFDIVDPADLETEEPREQNGKKVIKEKVIEENEEGEPCEVEKYKSRCLRLSNNRICDYGSLMKITTKIVVEPESIFWIDLSVNEITKIDPVLCNFENLAILYLHGNAITDSAEVNKLSQLSKLYKLSLHCNPIASMKNYRSMVLAALPNLKNMDMSPVTKSDRATAANYKASNRNVKKKKTKEGD